MSGGGVGGVTGPATAERRREKRWCGCVISPATAERRRERRSIGGVTSPATAERRRERRWKVVRMHGQCWSWMQAAGETAEKTWLSQSSALGEGGCCSLSRPSDDLKIS